jgi:Arc/MetJ-type ribon-helix-helix transcriptional regulator
LVRRNLTLPKVFVEHLGALRASTESSSDSEVIRRAITTYEQFADDTDANVQLWVREAHSGVCKAIQMGGLSEFEPKDAVKVNLILHEGSEKRLDELRHRTGASSDSEVVRKALLLYCILVNECARDSKLELRYPDGEVAEVRFWGIPKHPTAIPFDIHRLHDERHFGAREVVRAAGN